MDRLQLRAKLLLSSSSPDCRGKSCAHLGGRCKGRIDVRKDGEENTASVIGRNERDQGDNLAAESKECRDADREDKGDGGAGSLSANLFPLLWSSAA